MPDKIEGFANHLIYQSNPVTSLYCEKKARSLDKNQVQLQAPRSDAGRWIPR